jgi:serine protease Do
MPVPTITRLAAEVGPAIIGLREGSRGGSGVIVAAGVAVTLARNVHHDELTVRVANVDLAARVAGVDPTIDLAVLRFESPPSTKPVGWAEDGGVGIGFEVYALADPSGHGLRASHGSVSSAPIGLRGPAGRIIDGAIEHTAPLPRGSGGSPLLNADGLILGLNAIRRDEGFVVAWPAAVLRDRVAALADGARTAPPRLGVALAGSRQARRLRAAVGLEPVDGLLVRAVEEGSAAERSGIARGDVIVAVDGSPLTGPDPLYAALDGAGGREIELEIVRGTDRLTLTTRLDGSDEQRDDG